MSTTAYWCKLSITPVIFLLLPSSKFICGTSSAHSWQFMAETKAFPIDSARSPLSPGRMAFVSPRRLRNRIFMGFSWDLNGSSVGFLWDSPKHEAAMTKRPPFGVLGFWPRSIYSCVLSLAISLSNEVVYNGCNLHDIPWTTPMVLPCLLVKSEFLVKSHYIQIPDISPHIFQ